MLAGFDDELPVCAQDALALAQTVLVEFGDREVLEVACGVNLVSNG